MGYSLLEASMVEEMPYFSFWQSKIWQKILIESGQAKEVFYFGNLSGENLLVEIRSIGHGQYAAFSLGTSSVQMGDISSTFFRELFSVLRQKECIFYQIEPLDEKDLTKSTGYTFLASKKSSFVYKNFLTPHTRLLDLRPTEDTILKQMHEKGRYNIGLAERRGVIVQAADPTLENIELWMALLDETTDRDGFSRNSRLYYETFLREISSTGLGELLFARFEGKVIAAMIVIYFPSRVIYYYGASKTEKELRKHMAPYLLQWHAIREAKRRNITLYDFLGIADPHNKNDPLRSVTEFKEKFGGYISVLPEKLCIPLSWKGTIFLFFRFLLKR